MKQEFNIGDKIYFLLEHMHGMGRRFIVKEGFIDSVWKSVFVYKDRISGEQQETLHDINYEVEYDLCAFSYKNPSRTTVSQKDLYKTKEEIIK